MIKKEHTLTRDFFRLWLERCEPDAVVGGAMAVCGCPIAKYLEWETRGIWSVSRDSYRHENLCKPMPLWGKCFIVAIDRDGERNITAAQCLAVLGNIPGSRSGVTT
jgi:hypothetical protein